MIYLTLFLIGLFGLVIQVLLGLVEVGGHVHGGHLGHGGHEHGGGLGHAGHGNGGGLGHAGHGNGGGLGHAGHGNGGGLEHAGHGNGGGHGHAGHGNGAHTDHAHSGQVIRIGQGHAGHAHGASGDAAHGELAHEHGQDDDPAGRGLSALWSLFSPMTLFSLCLGAGATGMLLSPMHIPGIMVGALAAVGGVGFFALGVRPLARLIYGFASKPSKGLVSAVSKPAEAVTRFDNSGKGLVRLTVDGHLVQVLASLEEDERAEAAAIVPGDILTITSVDGKTNTCRVTRL